LPGGLCGAGLRGVDLGAGFLCAARFALGGLEEASASYSVPPVPRVGGAATGAATPPGLSSALAPGVAQTASRAAQAATERAPVRVALRMVH
jgi:hypothetical protein